MCVSSPRALRASRASGGNSRSTVSHTDAFETTARLALIVRPSFWSVIPTASFPSIATEATGDARAIFPPYFRTPLASASTIAWLPPIG